MAEVSQRRRNRLLAGLDLFFFVFGGVAAIWLAYLVLEAGISPGWPMLLVLVFWVLVAYLALPRIHRILTAIYLPDYFIGRARTADGLLGDPVNLALREAPPRSTTRWALPAGRGPTTSLWPRVGGSSVPRSPAAATPRRR